MCGPCAVIFKFNDYFYEILYCYSIAGNYNAILQVLPVTESALVRALTSVHAYVLFEMTGFTECCITHITLVWTIQTHSVARKKNCTVAGNSLYKSCNSEPQPVNLCSLKYEDITCLPHRR
jgi:hypothetical protein